MLQFVTNVTNQKYMYICYMFTQCPLFKGLSADETEQLLDDKYYLATYKTGELIAMQSSRYDRLLIVSEGLVRGEMTDSLGRSTLIEEIQSPRAIAPAFLYASENLLPVSIIASVPTIICYIRKEDFTLMMQKDTRLLTNYLQTMADRSRFLSEKLRMQRFGSIKSKLARYLLEMSSRQKSSDFIIPHTQQELADIFGVTRPALARVIGQMEQEFIIKSKGKSFQIIERKKLLEYLE